MSPPPYQLKSWLVRSPGLQVGSSPGCIQTCPLGRIETLDRSGHLELKLLGQQNTWKAQNRRGYLLPPPSPTPTYLLPPAI